MDFTAIGQTIYFASGIIASIIGGYGYIKTQNKTLYPIEKIEAGKEKILTLIGENEAGIKKIQALTSENEACKSLKEIVGNISETELKNILTTAGKYADKGSITVDEAKTLGVMIVKAVETKD